MYIIFPNHVNIGHAHSQTFEHCRTTVITIVTKCILSVALDVTGHKLVTKREICCLYVIGDIIYYVIKYSKSEITFDILSLYTSVSPVSHSNISEEAS